MASNTFVISGVIPKDKWQQAGSTKVCQYQDCGKSFGLFGKKSSCHRCGIVICSSCVNNTTVPGHYEQEVPVCPKCFENIEKQKKKKSAMPVPTPKPPSNSGSLSNLTAASLFEHQQIQDQQEQQSKLASAPPQQPSASPTTPAAEDASAAPLSARPRRDSNASILSRTPSMAASSYHPSLDSASPTEQYIGSLVISRKDKDELLKTLRSERAKSEQQNQALEQKLNESDTQLKHTTATVQQLQEQLLINATTDSQQKRQLAAATQQLEAKVAELTSARDAALARAAEHEDNHAKLSSESAAATQQLEAKVAELTSEREVLRSSKTVVRKGLDEVVALLQVDGVEDLDSYEGWRKLAEELTAHERDKASLDRREACVAAALVELNKKRTVFEEERSSYELRLLQEEEAFGEYHSDVKAEVVVLEEQRRKLTLEIQSLSRRCREMGSMNHTTVTEDDAAVLADDAPCNADERVIDIGEGVGGGVLSPSELFAEPVECDELPCEVPVTVDQRSDTLRLREEQLAIREAQLKRIVTAMKEKHTEWKERMSDTSARLLTSREMKEREQRLEAMEADLRLREQRVVLATDQHKHLDARRVLADEADRRAAVVLFQATEAKDVAMRMLQAAKNVQDALRHQAGAASSVGVSIPAEHDIAAISRRAEALRESLLRYDDRLYTKSAAESVPPMGPQSHNRRDASPIRRVERAVQGFTELAASSQSRTASRRSLY